MISSLFEAATGSALRVLDDSLLSYRKVGRPTKETPTQLRPLTELGLLIASPNGRFRLLPLSESGKWVYLNESAFKDQKSFKLSQPEFWFIPKSELGPKTNGKRKLGEQLAGNVPLRSKRQWEQENKPLDWIPGVLYVLGKRTGMPRKTHELFLPLVHPDDLEDRTRFECLLKGQPEKGPTVPVLPQAIDCFHELADQLFDPEPPENTPIRDLLPYTPKARDRRLGHKLRLRHGDVVYYRTESGSVVEVSFSAIWRTANQITDSDGKVRGLTVHDFINEISPELLPYTPRRRHISPADAIFGCVSTVAPGENERFVRAYASRLRFGFGCIASGPGLEGSAGKDSYYMPPVTLKQLSSPKLPCPSMYFTPERVQGDYIAKHELNLRDHQPQGRKLYLHEPDAKTPSLYASKVPKRIADLECKQSLNNLEKKELNNRRNQIQNHMKVEPLPPETTFFFHVDFDNLSDRELGALCYALKPCEGFYHKLGLGKPLGLGSVKIDPIGVFLVERARRYAESVFSKTRYQKVWCPEVAIAWPERYAMERAAVQSGASPDFDFKRLRDSFAGDLKRSQPDVASAIEWVGAWDKGRPSVHYPPNLEIARGGPALAEPLPEDNIYEWFVGNDGNKITVRRNGQRISYRPQTTQEQHLNPISPDDAQVAPLKQHDWTES